MFGATSNSTNVSPPVTASNSPSSSKDLFFFAHCYSELFLTLGYGLLMCLQYFESFLVVGIVQAPVLCHAGLHRGQSSVAPTPRTEHKKCPQCLFAWSSALSNPRHKNSKYCQQRNEYSHGRMPVPPRGDYFFATAHCSEIICS